MGLHDILDPGCFLQQGWDNCPVTIGGGGGGLVSLELVVSIPWFVAIFEVEVDLI